MREAVVPTLTALQAGSKMVLPFNREQSEAVLMMPVTVKTLKDLARACLLSDMAAAETELRRRRRPEPEGDEDAPPA